MCTSLQGGEDEGCVCVPSVSGNSHKVRDGRPCDRLNLEMCEDQRGSSRRSIKFLLVPSGAQSSVDFVSGRWLCARSGFRMAARQRARYQPPQ